MLVTRVRLDDDEVEVVIRVSSLFSRTWWGYYGFYLVDDMGKPIPSIEHEFGRTVNGLVMSGKLFRGWKRMRLGQGKALKGARLSYLLHNAERIYNGHILPSYIKIVVEQQRFPFKDSIISIRLGDEPVAGYIMFI